MCWICLFKYSCPTQTNKVIWSRGNVVIPARQFIYIGVETVNHYPCHEVCTLKATWKLHAIRNTGKIFLVQTKKPLCCDVRSEYGSRFSFYQARMRRVVEESHYDARKPLLLQTDASHYGLGTVISHIIPDGTERPISFASRTMTEHEKNYAQYEKEGLPIMFGLKKFLKFLHGRSFTIVTDHQPLVHLFGDQKPTSPMASARVTRWHMSLSAYNYKIVHKKGSEHLNADALSRLPLPCQDDEMHSLYEDEEAVSIHLLSDLDTQPVTAEEVKKETRKDPVLRRVREHLSRGWPDKSNIDPDLQAYYSRKDELSVEDDIILWGRQVVIPQAPDIRTQLLSELHYTHPGLVKMEALARSYFWWSKLDSELELVVRTCPECQENKKAPPRCPCTPGSFPRTHGSGYT